jgi:hypothetical protein
MVGWRTLYGRLSGALVSREQDKGPPQRLKTMTNLNSKRLAWLFVAALATTTAMTAPPTAAEPDPVRGPALRNTLDNCVAFWDAGTHMSKAEWRAACQRTVNGTEMGMGGLDASTPGNPATGEGRRRGPAASSRR